MSEAEWRETWNLFDEKRTGSVAKSDFIHIVRSLGMLFLVHSHEKAVCISNQLLFFFMLSNSLYTFFSTTDIDLAYHIQFLGY